MDLQASQKNQLNQVTNPRNINTIFKSQNTPRNYGSILGLTTQHQIMDDAKSHILIVMTLNLLQLK